MMQRQFTLTEMLTNVSEVLNQKKFLTQENAILLKQAINDINPNSMESFDQLDSAEQAKIVKLGRRVHALIADFEITNTNSVTEQERKNFYNLSLWLSYSFPLNAVNEKGEMICPYSKKVLNLKDSFVSEKGYYYSKQALVEIKDNDLEIKKHLSIYDISSLKDSLNLKHDPKYDSTYSGDLALYVMLTIEVVLFFACMIAGGFVFPPLLGVGFMVGVVLGQVVGAIGGVFVGGVIGLVTAGIYELFNLPKLRDRELPFSHPPRPLIESDLKFKLQKSIEQQLAIHVNEHEAKQKPPTDVNIHEQSVALEKLVSDTNQQINSILQELSETITTSIQSLDSNGKANEPERKAFFEVKDTIDNILKTSYSPNNFPNPMHNLTFGAFDSVLQCIKKENDLLKKTIQPSNALQQWQRIISNSLKKFAKLIRTSKQSVEDNEFSRFAEGQKLNDFNATLSKSLTAINNLNNDINAKKKLLEVQPLLFGSPTQSSTKEVAATNKIKHQKGLSK